MFGFIKGVTEAVAKTVIGVPVAIVAEVVTLGGELNGKRSHGSYTGNMISSAAKSIEEAAHD